MRRAGLLVLAAALAGGAVASSGGCHRRDAGRNLDLQLIGVSPDASLRTDTVGGGAFAETATFVLVDAENRATEGAHVTLGGALVEESGAVAGELKPQSLWIPAGESRTFALVDTERKPRPSATTARIEVRGALVPGDPPRARIEELHRFPAGDRLVVQAYLVNDADRIGQIVVIGAFHDEANRPMTRPFELIEIAPKSRQVVKFTSPPRAKRGTIFVGDVVY
jgi:hypothetical protein